MTIDTPPIPPVGESEETNKKSKVLLGCLIALILALVILCCGITALLMPLFSDYDPLGTGLREKIEEVIPSEYLEDPSSIPGFDDLLEDTASDLDDFDFDFGSNETGDAQDIPRSMFYFTDIMVSFEYPVGWEIEMEGYTVTFYHPRDYTYIYLGEYGVDEGDTAEEVAYEFMATVEEDAQEGTFKLISNADYSLPLAEDAYLVLFEWIDLDGYYNWAYDLEIVIEESNISIILFGEIEDEIPYYGDLLDIIASSMEWMEE